MSLSVSATVRSVLLSFSSMWHCNDRRAKPAGFCLTGKSQAELAVLIVNNKSLLRQSPTAGTYHQAAESTLFLWPLVGFHSNSLMKMSHPQIVLLCIGGKLVLGKWVRVQPPCEPAPCQAGCKPIWCWCSRDSVRDRNTVQLPLFQRVEAGLKGWYRAQVFLFVVLVECRMARGWNVYLSKSREVKKWSKTREGKVVWPSEGLLVSFQVTPNLFIIDMWWNNSVCDDWHEPMTEFRFLHIPHL